jgi:hypothetical protein
METELYETIFSYVLTYWHEIKNDSELYDTLNLEENIVCQKNKQLFPSFDDETIKKYTFSMYLILYQIINNIYQQDIID